jgi:exodeoxyribonuclease V alpha subunit
MSESASYPASTIHRILGYNHVKGGFLRNEKSPLNVDLIVVDEASMVDTILMYQLLRAIPDEASLVLVGDINQLPSVGPGNVLADIIRSSMVGVVELKEIHRQSAGSRIIVNAHRVNMGLMPELTPPGDEAGDFYFIEQEDPEKILNIIKELVTNRIPERFRMDPMEDIQILCPMHKGMVGTDNLNRVLQSTLNRQESLIQRGERSFKLNDRVMQVRNNYEKEVFNGDIGKVKMVQKDTGALIVDFDGRDVIYDSSELDELVLAYAISVHKSQGSEYPCVIIPLLMQHYILLQRNLLYTAITRAKKLVIIIGNKRALAYCVKNTRTIKRYTLLERRLKEDSLNLPSSQSSPRIHP